MWILTTGLKFLMAWIKLTFFLMSFSIITLTYLMLCRIQGVPTKLKKRCL